MADSYQKSLQYITDFVKWLAPDAEIRHAPGLTCYIDFHNDRTELRFDQAELEDFEVALERFQNTSYFRTLENRLRFRILGGTRLG